MFRSWLIALSVFSVCASAQAQSVSTNEQQSSGVSSKSCVLLIHGLARTSASMKQMNAALLQQGYAVANIDYPSRTKPIEQLAPIAFNTGFELCKKQNAEPHYVVTHSLGGILLRQYLKTHSDAAFERAVMLAPPNQGSEVVDELKEVPGYQWLNGPAGAQLGTGPNSVPLQLGPVNMDVAVIAGSFSINIVLSTYLPDPDDGKVSVASTKLKGMCAHLVVDVSHPYIMKDDQVIAEVLNYLANGRFESADASYTTCAANKG